MATPAKKPSSPKPTLQADDVTELKAGVVALAGRVTQLAEALQTVNQVQRRMTEAETSMAAIKKDANVAQKRADVAQEKADTLEGTMVPREEHERIWKAEQQKLIDTRLSIRRQTYALFFLAMLALGIVAILVFRDLGAQANQHHREQVARCEQGNQFRRDDHSLWEEVISISLANQERPQTSQEKVATKQFQAFLDKHDALTDCSKVK